MTFDAASRFRAARLARAFADARQAKAQSAATQDPTGELIPIFGVAALTGELTGDGRVFDHGSLEWDLEHTSVPLIWDISDGDHDGVTVGKLTSIVADGGAIHVEGHLYSTAPDIDHLLTIVGDQAVGWSVMIDQVTGYLEQSGAEVDDEAYQSFRYDDDVLHVTHGRLRHLAIVDTPAFASARPVLGEAPTVASVATMPGLTFPAEHFVRWESSAPVPLQVTCDGHVWGHAAGDGCYRGNTASCQRYSRDPDPQLRNFHTHSTTLHDGAVIRTGALTCANLHANPKDSRVEAQRRHHEDTSTVWAKVVAWEDKHGRLCVSGSVVPGLDPSLLSAVAGAPISVEQWPVPGQRGVTLVAAHSVVTPAWPVESR